MNTLGGAFHFDNSMRERMVEAVTLLHSGTEAHSTSVLSLGRRWWEDIVISVTAGGDETTVAVLTRNNHRENWPVADLKLFGQAEGFINSALEAYILANHIKVPESILGGNK
jgi:hypothetical protein